MPESRDEFVQRLKDQLDEWNDEIGELQERAEQAQEDARIRYQQEIRRLREEQAQAQMKLQKLRDASEGAWEELKDGVERAWESLEEAVARAKSKFD